MMGLSASARGPHRDIFSRLSRSAAVGGVSARLGFLPLSFPPSASLLDARFHWRSSAAKSAPGALLANLMYFCAWRSDKPKLSASHVPQVPWSHSFFALTRAA